VQTADMKANHLTEYEAVAALATPDSAPYLSLLSRAYNRLYDFRQYRGGDTALDAALDIFLYTVEYYDAVTETDFDAMEPEIARNIGNEIVMVWHQILVGATRAGPLTARPMFTPRIFARFNVTNMWQHHTGRRSAIDDIWGVSGFDPRFVGERNNENQVEHIAISMTLQMVSQVPLLILNAIEDRDTLTGRQSPAHARADQNINNAIAFEFIPRFVDDYVRGIEHLRCVLSSNEVDAAKCQ
jgi:hypothetical protein